VKEKIHVDVHVHGFPSQGGDASAKLDEIISLLKKMEISMAGEFDRLKASITAETDARIAIVKVLEDIAAKLRELAAQPHVDPAEVSAMADAVDANTAALAAAAVANTPAAPQTT
jgi:hypothetical protein